MERRVSNTSRIIKRGASEATYYTYKDDALVISRGNPKRNGHYISGGPFFVRHRTSNDLAVGPLCSGTNSLTGDKLEFTPFIGASTTTPLVPRTPSQLNQDATIGIADAFSYGATGWKRARPGNPTAGLANALAEARDLPKIPFRLFMRLKTFRSLGSEYLNGAFGWIPFVNDVKDMYETYLTMDKKLAQIVRDNGKGVHRRRTIKDVKTTSAPQISGGGNYPFHGWGAAPAFSASGGYGRVEIVNVQRERVWFVGKFRYYIPDIGSSQWTKRATRALYGANVTPEVIYNALPWTWLMDWFGNVGDVMSNMSSNAVDNLTADYAYIMREVEDSQVWSGVGTAPPNTLWGFAGASSSLSVTTHSTVTRGRAAASPFGFGFHFDGLTPYQMGIAAALGISRWA